MPAVLVVGMQWGDEGKGKVVDLLSERAQVVARYQGGHNAGHTVFIGEERFILHLVPTGVLRPGVRCVIGSGVVVEPRALIQEVEELRSRGIAIGGNLFLSKRAHLIMPYHLYLDREIEKLMGGKCIGTTGRGIGPAYADKAGRLGIRVADIFDEALFRERLELNLLLKKSLLPLLREEGDDSLPEEFDLDSIFEAYQALRPELEPFVADTESLLLQALSEGECVLLEGAQGTMLDVDHGTYPYVTSSSPMAGGASAGLGIPPASVSYTLGVTKAYTTRVGRGPFPTEMAGPEGDCIRERGKAWGATTGRPRRCGWVAAVAARYAIARNGIDSMALMKLDVLDGCDEVRLCTAYECDGQSIEDFPAEQSVLFSCRPRYEVFPGWRESTLGASGFRELPERARNYVQALEEAVGREVSIICTGPRRDQVIWKRELSLP
ncbi:MAG: adenylosuccinate synthase [Nitrospinota bacterium]